MEGEKKRGWWPICSAVAFTVLVAYPLSIGPTVGLSSRLGNPEWIQVVANVIYAPLQWVIDHSPVSVDDWTRWYLELWL